MPRISALLLLSALGCQQRNLDQVGDAKVPFVFVVSPEYASANEGELEKLLSEGSGLAVDLRVAASLPAVLAAIGAKHADAALMPDFGYVFAREEYGVTAGLRVLRHGAERSSRGELVVPEDGAKQLSDLNGKEIAFADRYSTSGFLFPLAMLRSANVTPVVTFAGSHEKALQAVRDGKVAAAAVYGGLSKGVAGVRVLEQTAEIPNEPIVFRAALDPAKQKRFTDALLKLTGNAALASMADITGFAPTSDAEYAEVTASLATAGKQAADLVPGGWSLRNEARRPLEAYAP